MRRANPPSRREKPEAAKKILLGGVFPAGDMVKAAELRYAAESLRRVFPKAELHIAGENGVPAYGFPGGVPVEQLRETIRQYDAFGWIGTPVSGGELMPGAELLEALEASTYCTPDSIGGFPQVSGIVYTIDGTKTYDAGDVYEGSTYHAPKTIRRVTIQSVGGKAFNLRTVYTIATNDFLAAGGDTYYAFKTASVNYDLGIPMDEVVMDYVKTELKGVVSAENYGEAGDRITIIKGLPFTDVDPSAAYYSAVKYCYENNIFKGVTDTMFMPNNTITRGQMVTVLWRMNGSPEPKNANPFGDVAATSPFVKAIAWAAENKLTNGITETTFAPAQAISRQQFLTILYRYAQFMGYDVSVGEDTNILSFEDVGEVGEYAIPAMQWAVGSGVLAAEKTLTPRAAAPRYNVAEFLANFCMKVIPTAEMMPKAA